MKNVHVIGGGTLSHVRSHLALAAPAYGTTAKYIFNRIRYSPDNWNVFLHLTKMADSSSLLETWEDLNQLVDKLVNNSDTKIVFWNPAIVDFNGAVNNETSGKYAPRLESGSGQLAIIVEPYPKLIQQFRQKRKDIFLVGFKTTTGADLQTQYVKGLKLLKESSCNLVLANDNYTRMNMIIVPEEAVYHISSDRERVLDHLITMALQRSNLHFTRTKVIEGAPTEWDSDFIPPTLRKVVDYCVANGAYKPFLGSTAGHFAVKVSEDSFVTSRRKTNFNDLYNVGMVFCVAKGDDQVIAYGSKPSVGGQSQRIIFKQWPQYDCIVHFHCVKLADSVVPAVSQEPFECGSHECGENTSKGLKDFGWGAAIYLDNHGPNLVFNRDANPDQIIDFIKHNFDLSTKSGGFQLQ